jgi:methylenetetrahydrofolate reductase (NADPH)
MTTGILTGYSLEITGKDVKGLREAQHLIPPGTRVNIAYLGTEDEPLRVAACTAVIEMGFVPVPHIAARRIGSETELRTYLERLQEVGGVSELFVVGGDPHVPAGPFASSQDVIESGILQSYGVRKVGVAGYPEGHPGITNEVLAESLIRKEKALRAGGLDGGIITQFAFGADAVVGWIERTREAGVQLPVRIGVPGPAGVKRLLSFARRFGVSSSAGIAKKYGFSLTNLMATAGPDRLLSDLEGQVDTAVHGRVSVHFYTFGGITKTAGWIRDFGPGR